jgi:hypothetical protein
VTWSGFRPQELADRGITKLAYEKPSFTGGGARGPCLIAVTIVKVFADGARVADEYEFQPETMMWSVFQGAILRLNAELASLGEFRD